MCIRDSLMDQVFRDLPFAFVYLDDILVAIRDESEHKQHLREVLGKLRNNGMAVNASKCVSGQSSVKYLGQELFWLKKTADRWVSFRGNFRQRSRNTPRSIRNSSESRKRSVTSGTWWKEGSS